MTKTGHIQTFYQSFFKKNFKVLYLTSTGFSQVQWKEILTRMVTENEQ